MFDVAVLQHETGIAFGVTAINEALHVGEEPVNGTGSWGEREEGKGGEGNRSGEEEMGGEGKGTGGGKKGDGRRGKGYRRGKERGWEGMGGEGGEERE